MFKSKVVKIIKSRIILLLTRLRDPCLHMTTLGLGLLLEALHRVFHVLSWVDISPVQPRRKDGLVQEAGSGQYHVSGD